MEFLEPIVKTDKNILLKGKYLKTHTDACVIFVPGLGGDFDRLSKLVAETCIKEGYSFIWARNQSCMLDTTVKYENNGIIHDVPAGAMYENFNNAPYDIWAWVKFAINEGYKKIAFVGHCYGCNKIVYFLNKCNLSEFTGGIFLAPIDVNLLKDDRYNQLVQEAVNNVRNKQPNKIISKQLFGFCNLTSAAFLRLCYNPKIEVMPYRQKSGKYAMLENIKKPLLFVIGSNDAGLENKSVEYATTLMEKLTSYTTKGDFKVVKDAKHSFKGNEDDVSEIITAFLKERLKKGGNSNEYLPS